MKSPHWVIADLAQARGKDRMSRAQVGEKIGRSEAAVAAWETGINEPALAKVEEWAALHGLRLALIPAEGSSASDDILAVVRARAMLASGEARRIRQAAGLSLREAAAAIGANNKTLIKWESGESAPTAYYAAPYGRLLEALRREVAS